MNNAELIKLFKTINKTLELLNNRVVIIEKQLANRKDN
tara:strand:- start:18436 stop:18549 length:114 start_codon:yes stop_codon:yes gene_type:complete